MSKHLIGKVKHYFDRIGVAVIELSSDLNEGEQILIESHGSSLQQAADSMQIDRKPVQHAHKGQAIGLKVQGAVREGDNVFKVE
jgi:peptide subunit release factor RF-3